MIVVNAMFSKVNGGLEQVFLNYTPALRKQGNRVLSVIHPQAEIKEACEQTDLFQIHNYNQYDPVAIYKLRQFLAKNQPDCIITHSYRAAYLFKKTRTKIPKVAVCHVRSHYEFGTDAIIALTDSMREEIIGSGQPAETIFTVPNMIHIPTNTRFQPPKDYDIPVIGACARMAHIKGLDVFIDALGELKRRNIPFKARIAGDGPERQQYLKLSSKHNLENHLEFAGWVEDTDAFYKSLDVFCLPSREEAFGMVVLEGMRHSLPMVLTDLSGPGGIVGDSDCALMVPPNNPLHMADALERVICDKLLAYKLAENAFKRVHYFSEESVGPKLHSTLEAICSLKI